MNVSQQHYLDWFAKLHDLLEKVRKGGLLAIECDLGGWGLSQDEFPTLCSPYTDFTLSLVNMMIDGNLDPDDLTVFAEAAIESYALHPNFSAPLMKSIWLCFWAALRGYQPDHAVRFGAQAVPWEMKLSDDQFRAIFFPSRQPADCQELRQNVSDFVRSLV